MKSRDSALRVMRFAAIEKSRKVSDLEYMIREFEQMAVDLELQIKAEEDRTGARNPEHFSYSMFAKAAAGRRDKLRASVNDLREKLENAVRELNEATSELDRSGSAETREVDRVTQRSPERLSSFAG